VKTHLQYHQYNLVEFISKFPLVSGSGKNGCAIHVNLPPDLGIAFGILTTLDCAVEAPTPAMLRAIWSLSHPLELKG